MKKYLFLITLTACLSCLILTTCQKDQLPVDSQMVKSYETGQTALGLIPINCSYYGPVTFKLDYTGTVEFNIDLSEFNYKLECLEDAFFVIRCQKTVKPSLSAVNIYINDVLVLSNKYFSKDYAQRFIPPVSPNSLLKIKMTGKAGASIELLLETGIDEFATCTICP